MEPGSECILEGKSMQYLASHYWRSTTENSPSLMLQQVYHKQRQLPVLMACICSDDKNSLLGKRMITGLTDWFYETGLSLVARKGEKGIGKIGKKLECYLNQPQNDMDGMHLSGVFCVGNSLVLWKMGGAKVFLLNQRNGNAHVTEWYPEMVGGPVFQRGLIQRETGIFLSAKFSGLPKPVSVKACKEQMEVENCLKKMSAEASILLITK